MTFSIRLCSAFVFFALSTHCQAKPLPTVSPESIGLDSRQLEFIAPLVAPEIKQGNLPGCVAMVGRKGAIGYAEAFGHRQLEPTAEEMTLDTVFDMASITKPTATATSIMILVERGQIRLRDPVARYIPEFAQNGKETITVEQLLTHQGGLIPDNALADYQQGPQEAWKRIWALKPKYGIGKKFVYTDVGFLVLGELVHRITGKNVAQFAKENIYEPLAMNDTSYLPSPALRERIAPTEKRAGEWLRGEVHDPRAALLNGVAGHAGLFSTANDLALYANMMLSGGTLNGVRVMGSETIAEMTRARNVAGHRRGLGWDMRSKYSSNRGEFLSSSAFGHGGFTGTAMWIDPELDLFVIFLSSRLHPNGEGSVNHLAGRICTIAASAIKDNSVKSRSTISTSKPAYNTQTVITGIDALERDNFRQLEGRRVGLITNHTGLSRTGARTIDLLHEAKQVELVSIFSPEHGLQGKLDIANIDDARDEATGLPVHSLYGKTRKPLPKHLAEIDTLVFDIQDIGTRFYTYISTMGLAMEAAAEHDLQFVVLDRPNPINGTIIEGPLLDQGDESFVGFHDIPLRHGMTIGELAHMFRKERGWELKLEIIRCEDWHRSSYWDATGLTWTNPSPNMRCLNQAVLYPGVGLLETTNISVGRGTDTPFEIIGAPWIDGQELAAELNKSHLSGVRFVPIRFTPNTSKHANKQCGGVNIVIVNRNTLQPVDVGLQLACTLCKLYPTAWDTTRLNRLLINKEILSAIKSGQSTSAIKLLYQANLKEFLKRRAKYLLY